MKKYYWWKGTGLSMSSDKSMCLSKGSEIIACAANWNIDLSEAVEDSPVRQRETSKSVVCSTDFVGLESWVILSVLGKHPSKNLTLFIPQMDTIRVPDSSACRKGKLK